MKPDTPAMLKGLRWIQDRQPISVDRVSDGVSTITKNRLRAAHLIENCDAGGFVTLKTLRYIQVTDKGRQLLWENRA